MKNRTKLIFKISAIILFLAMAFEAFKIGIPYSITIGIMLISFSILCIPYLDKIIYIPKKGKFFIVGTNFLTAAYAVRVEDTKYYKCLIAALIMALFWVITIIYFKKKKKASKNK